MYTFKTCPAIILACLLFTVNLTAQTRTLKTFEKEYKDAIEETRKDLAKEDYCSPWDKSLTVEYETDLYKAEHYEIYMTGSSGTTMSMIEGLNASYDFYDMLLNKYYQKLLNRLNPKDQELLRQSQRNWIAFRDCEMKLSYLITDFHYSGGGSLEQVTTSARNVEIVKTRLQDIYKYMRRCISIEDVESFYLK